MNPRDVPQIEHEHPCGHDCECREWRSELCDRCELAEVVRRRHHLGDMPRGEILARLYLSMAMVAGDRSEQLTPIEAACIAGDPGMMNHASR